jgi:uncharacterized protein YecT (DUF1311 family)
MHTGRAALAHRDRIQQIIEWRARRGRTSVEYLIPGRVADLRYAWEAQKGGYETADFFPIRLVTLLEVFAREWIRRVVDRGSPYIERAETLTRSTKLDFVFSMALQGRRVTIGDLVAHAVSINDIGQMLKIFDLLLEDQFTKRLPLISDRWEVEVERVKAKPIIQNFDRTMKDLSRLFEIRHILVHELPVTKPYDSEEIDNFITASEEFVAAAEEILTFELEGAVPLTQMDMNQAAAADLEGEAANLAAILQKVRLGNINSGLLDAAQAAWQTFAECEARLHAHVVSGGSMEPMVYAATKSELVRLRSEQLRWWLERQDDDL